MLNGLWGFYFTRGHVKRALEISQELMAVAEQLNDPGSISDAHGQRGRRSATPGTYLPLAAILNRQPL